jgi:hypothetical protein
MNSFAENLKHLPSIIGVERIELFDPQGMPGGVISNQPGESGSLAIYNFLLGKWGDINAAAANEGLTLYGEHVQDARDNPGKHPNIDRLLILVLDASFYTGKIVHREI